MAQIPDQVVVEILSDTELILKEPGILKFDPNIEFDYKIIPKLDQSKVYESVWDALERQQTIGIFPEGGSHDRSDLLPLKAGVTIMALGAMEKSKCKVTIVPCGLKYFRRYKFRSQAIIEFGAPYEIPAQYAEIYSKNKREACSILLREIEQRMRDVTFTAPSYHELEAIYMAKKIYLPETHNLTKEEENELYKRFTKGYNAFRDKPEQRFLFEEIREYIAELKDLGVRDYQVKVIRLTFLNVFAKLIISAIRLTLSLAFALPGLILMTPVGLYLRYLADQERKKALAGSTVKLMGVDVMASKKIMSAIVIFPLVCIVFTAALFVGTGYFTDLSVYMRFVITVTFFILWPIYVYICIRSTDGTVRHFKTFTSRLLCLFYRNKIEKIQIMRQRLKLKITESISKYGPTLYENFEKRKIIHHDQSFSSDGDDGRISNTTSRKNSYMNDLALNQAFESLTELGL